MLLSISLDKLTNDIKDLKPYYKNKEVKVLSLEKVISLKNIFYDYPNSSRTALNDINLNIMAKSTVGLVGTTGEWQNNNCRYYFRFA